MARWIVEDIGKTVLEKLETDTMRRIRREMVLNGAKVLQKEIQADIEARHHVRHSWMKDSVAAGPVREDPEGTFVEVWPQGSDPRGVSNEMKLKIISHGYYHVITGRSQRKKDNFLNDRFRKKCAPRIMAVMEATLAKCMAELNNTGG